jgi:hypothetical protein
MDSLVDDFAGRKQAERGESNPGSENLLFSTNEDFGALPAALRANLGQPAREATMPDDVSPEEFHVEVKHHSPLPDRYTWQIQPRRPGTPRQ